MAERIVLQDGTNKEVGTAANPLVVSASFSPSGTQDVNQTQINGVAVSTGSGIMGTGVQRVVIASDNDAITVKQATATNLKVDASGVAVPVTDNSGSLTVDYATTGSGTATGALRVELPTNGTGVVGLNSGTNTIGNVIPVPSTSGGLVVAMMSSADGSTALTNSAQAIKASAGQLFGWYIYNPNSSASYVSIYNTAAASVTVGTTNPLMSLCIPATSGANCSFEHGIAFSNAGWSAAATTTGGGNTAPSTALEANFFYK